ncbi:hypothetical protein H257_13635 [Aphanomyces astaci]|uniref:Uncharacterized protein n=1 Tax=Aphanomyces astaci TaxID=112090 RepID=W4FTL4_APHAT|nr:hypothetical protein H257_13635 [Aphanomyces astaci]ETV70855.1 hypothetical protein H257_13635 [Aphanomyces astaci]|eukprot:XP_009839518.1 hypothetical protein H257_13635 [Aphanomyces astaci]
MSIVAATLGNTPNHAKYTCTSRFAFLRLEITLSNPSADSAAVVITSTTLKLQVASSIKQLFGTVGVATHNFDVLSVDQVPGTHGQVSSSAILRLRQESVTPLWSALALSTKFDKLPCKYHVTQVASSLVELASARYLTL